jgi:diguanylate cyclase (GGDEF)-like protein
MVTAIIWSMAAVTLLSGQLHEKSDKLRRAAESKLARQAMSDQLTGLLNRTGITRQLDVRWARFQQTGEASAIILMDIDHFKSINDTHGHDVGDKVLIAVGKALRPFMRQNDAIGRWGGEEFLVIIEKTNLHNLAQVAERLRRAVGELTESPALRADGIGACKVSASFGISMMAAQDDSYDAAIKRADQALYAAKSNGRNRVVFDPVLRLVA